MANLVVFWFLRPGGLARDLPAAGVVFYVWVGMFGVFVVAQFWAFAADLYTDERGRRLLPLIGIGATPGAVAGSFLTESDRVGAGARQRRAAPRGQRAARRVARPHARSPIAAVRPARRRATERERVGRQPPAAEVDVGERGSRWFAHDRYLLAVGGDRRSSRVGSARTARTCSSASCRRPSRKNLATARHLGPARDRASSSGRGRPRSTAASSSG